MNMLTIISPPETVHADPITDADILDRIDRADEWFSVAEPIINASFALDQLEGELMSAACLLGRKYDRDTIEIAKGRVAKAACALNAVLSGVRDDYLSDHSFPAPQPYRRPTDPAQAELWDALCQIQEDADERVARETLTVEAAVKRVERSL